MPSKTETIEKELENTPAPQGLVPGSEIGLRIYTPTIKGYKVKAAWYGDPGVGKTTLAATAMNHPDLSPLLVVNIEGGILSVIDDAGGRIKTIPKVIDFSNFADMEPLFQFLYADRTFASVLVDSFSELCKKNLDMVVASQLGKRSQNGKVRDSIDDAWQEDYGTMTQQMRRIIRNFRDLNKHVMFTAHAATNKEETKVFPSITPKLRETFMGYMDIVGFLYTQAEESGEGDTKTQRLVRKVLTQPYGRWEAKDRTPGGRLGMTTTDPTMPEIWAKIIGEDSASSN